MAKDMKPFKNWTIFFLGLVGSACSSGIDDSFDSAVSEPQSKDALVIFDSGNGPSQDAECTPDDLTRCQNKGPCNIIDCVENHCQYTPIKDCISCHTKNDCPSLNCKQSLCQEDRCTYIDDPDCIQCDDSDQCSANTCQIPVCENHQCKAIENPNCIPCESEHTCPHKPCQIAQCLKGECHYESKPDCAICTPQQLSACNPAGACEQAVCSPDRECEYQTKTNCFACNDIRDCPSAGDCQTVTCEAGQCQYQQALCSCSPDTPCPPGNPCQEPVCDSGTCRYRWLEGCVPCNGEDASLCPKAVCQEAFCEEGVCQIREKYDCITCDSVTDCPAAACKYPYCTKGECGLATKDDCETCKDASTCRKASCTETSCIDGSCVLTSIPDCQTCSLPEDCPSLSCQNANCEQGECKYTPKEDCNSCTRADQCPEKPCSAPSCQMGECQYFNLSGCSSCTTEEDCPIHPCKTAQCGDNGECSWTPGEDASACNPQPCQIASCLNGLCQFQTDAQCHSCRNASDCPIQPCKTAQCGDNGECSYSDDAQCIHCQNAQECPPSTDSCQTAECQGGSCHYSDNSLCCNEIHRCEPPLACVDARCVEPTVEWCRLVSLSPTQLVVNTEQTTASVQFFAAGLTDRTTGVDSDANLKVEIGYGTPLSTPSDDWHWVSATPTASWSHASDDAYQAQFSVSETGSYAVAARISLDNGQTFSLCDQNTTPGYQVSDAASLTVRSGGDSGLTLFFSEYVEGSSQHKALEIYNPTASEVDLSHCTVSMYNCGTSSCNSSGDKSSQLSGTLKGGHTAVLCGAQSEISSEVCTLSDLEAIKFNGNDALELACDGQVLDLLGVKSNPTVWGEDKTYVRNCGIRKGNPDGGHDMSSEWTTYSKDDVSHLGSHDTCY